MEVTSTNFFTPCRGGAGARGALCVRALRRGRFNTCSAQKISPAEPQGVCNDARRLPCPHLLLRHGHQVLGALAVHDEGAQRVEPVGGAGGADDRVAAGREPTSRGRAGGPLLGSRREQQFDPSRVWAPRCSIRAQGSLPDSMHGAKNSDTHTSWVADSRRAGPAHILRLPALTGAALGTRPLTSPPWPWPGWRTCTHRPPRSPRPGCWGAGQLRP